MAGMRTKGPTLLVAAVATALTASREGVTADDGTSCAQATASAMPPRPVAGSPAPVLVPQLSYMSLPLLLLRWNTSNHDSTPPTPTPPATSPSSLRPLRRTNEETWAEGPKRVFAELRKYERFPFWVSFLFLISHSPSESERERESSDSCSLLLSPFF